MTITKLMIANRGEIACRIATAAAELGLASVGVYSEDDAASLHTRMTDEAAGLNGKGASAYLDGAQIIEAALACGADAIHPGYGFLSESGAFARAVEEAGLTFVGPQPDVLDLFGDKAAARKLAETCDVELNPGLNHAVTLADAERFLEDLKARDPEASMVIKAAHGGGGRGMRVITDAADLASAFERCQSEAKAAFGNGDVYVERFLPFARHIEVQIVGDGKGPVVAIGERECSLQRRHQKLVEIAPAPFLPEGVRERIINAARAMADTVHYQGLGTFEFLVDAHELNDDSAFAFIEANARLQVEHTVTEEVSGVDLVAAQLRIAGGASLSDLGLDAEAPPRLSGFAIQLRINMETMGADGTAKPTGGTLKAFEPPSGPGVRVDTFGYQGYRTSPAFDSLLAKQITHTRGTDFGAAVDKAYRTLGAFRIEGLETNIGFLQNLLTEDAIRSGGFYTRYVDDHVAHLAKASHHKALHLGTTGAGTKGPGARLDTSDPLAVLAHGQAQAETSPEPLGADDVPDGQEGIRAPLQGTVVSLSVAEGDVVPAGADLVIMEAMKMEHVIAAPVSGRVTTLSVAAGDTVFEGHVLALLEPETFEGEAKETAVAVDLDTIRPDLQHVIDRHAFGLDENRPEAVAKRRKINHRTARENISDLCDDDSFIEYGALAVAAQKRRRSMEDLIKNTPGDGMVCGIGAVNGAQFSGKAAQVMAMSYDYMVLAGTQGGRNHQKKDRMFEIARDQRLPVVIFTEGGGGRPGDTDGTGVAGLDCLAFSLFGSLSGLVPLIGVNAGRCFAGNASLLGCCDVIIATEDSTIGMGGPAMIEGGNLGIYRPEEVGPMSVQVPNGVVDIAVKDEEEAVRVAKQYLSYFQGPIADYDVDDQRKLRTIIPENRLRIYDVREVIETLCDTGSVLELRRGFGLGMITAFGRIEGRPIGIIANNPEFLAGAITSDGADKAARFMQLCDAFDMPILMLCDTPGIMVGPEAEKTALVRHANRLFVTGGSLTVPFFTIVLRKGYGLGAQAMAGGSFHAPVFTIAWPTGEFGGMGLEGAVKLGYRNELAAIEDPVERKRVFDEMVAASYERGKATNMATALEIDDVIDPRDSRHWILRGLDAAPPPLPRSGKKRPMVDTW